MSTVTLELDTVVAELLRQRRQPIERAALELIVVELYRQRTISRGKAAELLGMTLDEFIDFAAQLDIPYFDLSEEEWEAEVARIKSRS
jgi:predicted HTH domain antitoxin